MKNIIKFKFIILFLLGIISCKSQQVYPLNASAFRTPTNSYFKDLNNELDPYIGTWKGTFQGNTTTLIITKELKRSYEMFGKNFFEDVLIIKYEVKDTNGNILQTSLNAVYPTGGSVKYLIISTGTNRDSNNEVNLAYAGGNCGAGGGEIKFQKISNTQFYWSYYPGVTTRNDVTCPPNLDYHIYLPETENLVFTKQ
ncbi:DUF6705 family protein [Epilithonimonas pallida]|uniref:DUF6705 domain-containing protein n=1 Tax=Epilithonimonas pallida TaxID=373671 RepID=A0ABY1R3M7_9FLAO|nr:DUF6705 family protein [Epilithonimonas pallida]SMP93681.1 hypothetical protein SAMN05421679_10543 [Epilithonimonas pallida]